MTACVPTILPKPLSGSATTKMTRRSSLWRHPCLIGVGIRGDEDDVRIYAEQMELEDFTRVALPQGLVASGFFANVVLLSFDEALRVALGTEITPGIQLADGVPVR